jgi:sec-independent protein translocase protein TatA
MFGLSPLHLILFAVVVLILFGRGRISEFMGDFGKGIKSFKEGMGDDKSPQQPPPPPAQLPQQSSEKPAEGERTETGDTKS